MKVVFGVLSLLVALAVVALVAKHQMQAVTALAPPGAASAPADPAQASRRIEEQFNADLQKALNSGADRNDDAERRESGDGK